MVNSDPGQSWWSIASVTPQPVDPATSVVPLPEITVGSIVDDDGDSMLDEDGTLIFDSSRDGLMSAIFALAKELRTLVGTLSNHFDDMIALLMKANHDAAAAITALTAEIASLKAAQVPPGNAVTDAQVAALQMQIDATTANAVQVEGLVAPPIPPASPV